MKNFEEDTKGFWGEAWKERCLKLLYVCEPLFICISA